MTDTHKNLIIEDKLITNGADPYLIAEVSGNHKNEISRAKQLIKEAHLAGFDAVKIQYFTAEDMTLDLRTNDFVVQSGLWQGRTLFDLYKEAATPKAWLVPLFNYAKECGITLFSSVFSYQGLRVLEELNCPAYKIASFEAMDIPLIEAVAKTHKPLIISTGIIDKEQISEALEACYQHGNYQVGIMHCISNYPAPPSSFNLNTIDDMIYAFNVPIGLSDHSIDALAAMLATAKGSCMVEKHITVSRDDGAIDSAFSLPISEMADFVTTVRNAYAACGQTDYSCSSPRKNYRSLYVVENIKKGEKFTKQNTRSIRPGHGIAPKHLNGILNKVAAEDIQRGTALTWQMVAK
ncbi:pseudaminic acid synthase [Pseudoalteromonas sp. YIC-656]|uniref:pseudaminic acid synthase n=1 Tax=Pseudoalteromonas pernae TaxID=3118054 RepID=UPI003241C280